MSRQLSTAETFETVHAVFSQINFNAYDYTTVKKSLLDYLKIYYAEDFNDFIESSELIAIIESFAYIAELLSYRLDMNAQENFMSTAQRRESILRLAKLISYRPFRNIPHRGLVKITSVTTTEPVIDIDGVSLSNTKINWNDSNNVRWKDQFLLVMNRILEQNFGTVSVDGRTQVDNVLFELYTLNNSNRQNSRVLSYTTAVSDTTFNMELVPVELTEDGPRERRPEDVSPFSMLYASDGLGDGSDTTGFLMFTKQGVLQKREAFFDGITPNLSLDIPVNNINHTDVFVNNVNSDTRKIFINDPTSTDFTNNDVRFGEWTEVGDENFENVIFNTKSSRRKYQVETLNNDQIRLIFGDGEFSDIPNGSFDVWFRTSANDSLPIPKSAISNETASFVYLDPLGRTQTFTFTFSLTAALQNASETESNEHIRRVAPNVYYTQDRMVNARDYNTYMLQDPRILRLQAVNRTFAGDSKYIAWHDPSDSYEDTKVFGNDLAIFRKREEPVNGLTTLINNAVSPTEVLDNTLEPLLSSVDYFLIIVSRLEAVRSNNLSYRQTFSGDALNDERTLIETELQNSIDQTNPNGTIGNIVSLYFSVENDQWTVNNSTQENILIFQITPIFESGNVHVGWKIDQATDSFVAYSDTTRFWNDNASDTQLNLNSLLVERDTLTVLAANTTANNKSIIGSDVKFNVLKRESLSGSDLDVIQSLNIIPTDINNDEIPDNLLQTNIFGDFILYSKDEITDTNDVNYGIDVLPSTGGFANTFELPNSYLQSFEDEDVELYVTRATGITERLFFGQDWSTPPLGNPSNSDASTVIRTWVQIRNTSTRTGDIYKIRAKRYVYFARTSTNDTFSVVEDTENVILTFFQEETSANNQRLYIRYEGRYPLNFSWFHSTPDLHLIDPSPSNIIDMFVITEGYFRNYNSYINGDISYLPSQPSSYELSQTFSNLLTSKMISDTVIMHSGNLRPLFGKRAKNSDQAIIKLVLTPQNTASQNDIKNKVIGVVRDFFDISNWNFGETFYFSELSAAIHSQLSSSVSSVVLVPNASKFQFGDLYQIESCQNEIFVPDISVSEIDIIDNLTSLNLNQ